MYARSPNRGKRFEKVKSGSGRGSNRSRRDVVNEANSVGSETFSARESPNFTFKPDFILAISEVQ